MWVCPFSGKCQANFATTIEVTSAVVATPFSTRRGCLGLHHSALAGPAAVTRAADAFDPQHRRDHVELFAHIFPDHMQHQFSRQGSLDQGWNPHLETTVVKVSVGMSDLLDV